MNTFSRLKLIIIALLCASSFCLKAQSISAQWLDENAMYRVAVAAPKAEAVRAEVYWGLPFELGENVGVSIYEQSTGLKVKDVFVREINEDKVTLAFRADREGVYQVYLLPKKDKTSTLWADKLKLNDYPVFRVLPVAQSSQVQTRLSKNPYDIAATKTQSDYFFSNTKEELIARIVPAEYPLNTNSRIPELWLGEVVDKNTKEDKNFVTKIFQSRQTKTQSVDTILISPKGKTLIQLGLLPTKKDQKLSVSILPANDGAEYFAISDRTQDLKTRQIKSWWAVADISKATSGDFYNFKIVVKSGSGEEKTIPVVLKVDAGKQQDQFVDDVLRMSVGGSVLEKFKKDLGSKPDLRFPVTLSDGYNVRSGENSLSISQQTSLPSQLYSNGKGLLSTPMLLVFTTDNGLRKIGVNKLAFTRKTGGVHSWQGEIKTHDMHVRITGSLNAHSLLEYQVEIVPLSDINFRDISLEFGMSSMVDQAAWDHEFVGENKNITLHPHLGQNAIWLGKGSSGVLVSLPTQQDNILASNTTSAIKLYKSHNTSLIISSGAFTAKKDCKYSLVYDFQLLPSDFARPKEDFEYIYFAQDSLPSAKGLKGAKILVLESSHLSQRDVDKQKLREIRGAGVKVVAAFEGFSMDCYSEKGTILASMGFSNTVSEERKYIKFDYSDTLAMFFVNRYKSLIASDFIDGVILSDDEFNTVNAELFSHLGREKNPDFVLYLKTSSYNTNTLFAAPWIDKVFVSSPNDQTDFSSQSGVNTFVLSEADDPFRSLINRNVPSLSQKDSKHADVTRRIWSLAQDLDLYNGKYFSSNDPKNPARCSNSRIDAACYLFDDKAVVIVKNRSQWAQDFTVDFDWKALGVERWQVDGLTAPDIEGVQKGQKLFLNTPIDIAPDRGLILELSWTKK